MNRIDQFILDNPNFAAGRLEAAEAIAAGQLGFRLLGKVVFSDCDAAAAELRSRFGIVLQVDGHCMVALDDAARAEGYNGRMMEEIESRFGGDVIDAVFREVERKAKKRRKRG